MRKLTNFLLVLVFLSIIFIAPTKVSAFDNSHLVEIAQKYLSKQKGQCKAFVQKMVREAGGSLGIGYRYCYLDAGKEISWNEAIKGDIIQLDIEKNHDRNFDLNSKNHQNHTSPMHTAIIIENYGNKTFKVIDSNWSRNDDEVVRIHDWNPWTTAGNKLHVHFYRLGEVTKNPINPPDPSENSSQPQLELQPVLSKNVTVVIGIDDTGSMDTNDPRKLRQESAKFFIDLLQKGDKAAVFRFGDDVTVLQSLIEISDGNREEIKNSIGLNAGQATDIDVAFNQAFEELSKDESGNPKFFIFLTDGRHAPKSKVLYQNSHIKLWDKGWKVYTVLLTNPLSQFSPPINDISFIPDPEFLKSITGEEQGKGKYFDAPNPENLQAIYSEISKQVQGQRVVFNPDPFFLKPNEEKELTFTLPKKSIGMQVITTWSGSTVSTEISADGYELNGSNYQIINTEDVKKIRDKKVKIKIKAIDVPEDGEEINLIVRAKIDKTPPELKIKVPFYSRKMKVLAKAKDNIGISQINVYCFEGDRWIREFSKKSSKISYHGKSKDGFYAVKVEAVDEVGNKSVVFTNTTIDSSKPKIVVSQKNPSWFKKAVVKVRATDPNLKSYEIVDGGKRIGSNGNQTILVAKNGDKITIKAEDKLGNKQVKIVKIDSSFWQMLWESVLYIIRSFSK